MNRYLLFIIISLLPVTGIHAEGENALLVWTKDGATIGYELTVRPQVKIDGTYVVLDAGEVSVSYPLTDYVRMMFGHWNFDAIEDIPATEGFFRIVDNKMNISHLKPGKEIGLWSVDGMLLWSGKADEKGSATVPLEGQGVRVFWTDNIRFKINKR